MIKKSLNSPWFMLVIFVIVSTAYLWPFLRHPAFNLIDDGWSLQTAHTLVTNLDLKTWQSTLIETRVGRLRPLYYLYFVPFYFLFKIQPFYFWLGQMMVLALTMWLMWKVISAITRDSVVSRVTPLLLLLFPSVVENFNRLGTAEPRQFLLHVGYCWWLVIFFKKKTLFPSDFLVASLLLLANFLSKESSLILVPMTVAVFGSKWLLNRKIEVKEFLLAGWIGLLTLGFLLSLPPRTGYTAGYQIQPAAMIKKALEMRLEQAELFWPLSVLLIATGWRVGLELGHSRFKNVKEAFTKLVWPGVFFIGIVLSLVLLLPWEYAKMERYFYVIIGLVVMYAGVEITRWGELLKQGVSQKSYRWVGVLVVGLVVLALLDKKSIFHNFGTRFESVFDRSNDAHSRLYKEYQLSYPLVKSLLNDVPDGSEIYVGDEDYERILHIGLFGSRLGQRSVKVFTTNELVPRDYGDRFVVPSTESGTLSQRFMQHPCPSTCFFIYRPSYYKPEIFGDLPLVEPHELLPDDMAAEIPHGQRWQMMRKP